MPPDEPRPDQRVPNDARPAWGTPDPVLPDANAGEPADGIPVFDGDGHLDEGAAHAFVDGALSDETAARVVLHLATCARCAALVAEARGLSAAAAGVLRRLDDGPGAVRVADVVAPVGGSDVGSARRTPPARGWWSGPQVRAAAAVVLVAGVSGSAYLATRAPRPATSQAVAAMTDSVRPAPTAAAAAFAPAAAAPLASAPPTATVPAPADSLTASPGAARLLDGRTGPPQVAARAAARAGGANRGESTVVAAAPQAEAAPPPARTSAFAALADASARAKRAAPTPTTGDSGAVGVVRGDVRDAQGRALAGADVVVRGTAAHATTDAAGRFVIPQVPAGAVTLRARRVGFQAETTVVAVGSADTTRATLQLGPSTLTSHQVPPAPPGSAPAVAIHDADQPVQRLAERRMRRTGTQQVVAPLGCFAIAAAGQASGAWPTPVVLGAGGVVTASGTVRGTWAQVGSDSLRLTRADGSASLALRRDRTGWTGTETRLTPATGAGCEGP